jgi:hypothetical protein
MQAKRRTDQAALAELTKKAAFRTLSFFLWALYIFFTFFASFFLFLLPLCENRAFLRNFYEVSKGSRAERRGKRTPNEESKPPHLYNIDIFLTISNKLERGKMQLRHLYYTHIYIQSNILLSIIYRLRYNAIYGANIAY